MLVPIRRFHLRLMTLFPFGEPSSFYISKTDYRESQPSPPRGRGIKNSLFCFFCACVTLHPKHHNVDLKLVPSPPWGRGWLATGALTSRGETGEGVRTVTAGAKLPLRIQLGTNPLTHRLAVPPLPQGGEGSRFQSTSARTRLDGTHLHTGPNGVRLGRAPLAPTFTAPARDLKPGNS
jgi:hypothetical protein